MYSMSRSSWRRRAKPGSCTSAGRGWRGATAGWPSLRRRSFRRIRASGDSIAPATWCGCAATASWNIWGAFSAARGQPFESIHDDFFLDLGGDSLSAVAVICALRKAGADSVATVRDLYEARTVAALCERLRGRGAVGVEPRTIRAPRARG